MARTLSGDFAPIIARARAKLTPVSVEEESDPTRAILTIQGYCGEYRVFIRAEQFLDELDSLVESINDVGRR